jgi:hypothetical protein
LRGGRRGPKRFERAAGANLPRACSAAGRHANGRSGRELSNWGRFYDIVMENPDQYGIANTANQCAGRAIFGEDPTACAAPETYFYFHDGHRSTTVHRIVARQLEREVKNAFE